MKKRTTSLVLSAALVLAALVPGLSQVSAARAVDYVPQLPKMPATTSVVVLDLTKDKSEHSWETAEALLAITTIQGIVNRTSSEKIYLVKAPQQWTGIWNPPATDQWALDDGMVPVPQTTPTLDSSKRFPVLSYLAEHYASFLNGKVTFPTMSVTGNDSAVMAAITAAAQEDAVPVSPTIEAYLADEGFTYATLADTRPFTTELEAFDWAMDNYFQDDTNRSFVAKHGFKYWGAKPDIVPMSFDYFVASKAFIYSLDSNKPEERAAAPLLLNTANYAPGTPVLGGINGELSEIDEIEENGYFFTFLDGANFSVHSSFPSDPAAITAPKEPTPVPVADNAAYVSFYVTDGDNLSIAQYNHHDHWKNSPAKGEIPIGWSLPPILLDLYPNKLQWLSENNYDDAYEIVSNYNDGGAPDTDDGEAAFTSAYKYYLDNSNGLFRTMNYFDTSPDGAKVIKAVAPYYAIRGYQGATNGNNVTWEYLDDTAASGISGVTQSAATPQEIANAVRYVVDRTPDGQPAFVMVSIGDGAHSGDPVVDAMGAVELLLADDDGRDYQFLRPVDLAATWKTTATIPPSSADYEAEDAVLGGSAEIFDNGQASGGYGVGGFYQGASLTWEGVAPGNSLAIRYANGSQFAGQVSVYVDGVDVDTVTLPLTASWDTFETVTVPIQVAGTVMLRVDPDDAAVIGSPSYTAGNIDKISSIMTPVPVSIDEQPESVTVTEGDEVSFSVTASGFPPPGYQWQVSTDGGDTFENIPDATTDELQLTGVALANDGTQYRVRVANAANEVLAVYSDAATLTVVELPDTENPSVTLSLSGTPSNGWYGQGTEATLSATDDSGIDLVEYELGDGGWIEYVAPFDVPEGEYAIRFRATDNHGNVSEPQARNVKVDLTDPTVWGWLDDEGQLTSVGKDALSGLDRVQFSLDGAYWVDSLGALGDDLTSVEIRGIDIAGNVSDSLSLSRSAAAPPLTVAPGDVIDIQQGGHEPGESIRVELHSDPVVLGTVTADSSGVIALTATIPPSVPAGLHTLVFIGSSSVEIPIDVLASTGVNAMPIIALALLALVAGGGVLFARRRRGVVV